MPTETIGISPSNDTIREEFFRAIFREGEGYFFICTGKSWEPAPRRAWQEYAFRWPDDLEKALAFINRSLASKDIYFCSQLFSEPHRRKEYASSCSVVWADLDECDPELITPKPSVAIQSSPGRYHAYWFLDEPAAPSTAEDIAMRIAYMYEAFGADKKGWDLTQVLRVPVTYNFKRKEDIGTAVVKIVRGPGTMFSTEDFKGLPAVPGFEYVESPLPETNGLLPNEILKRYRSKLDVRAHALYDTEPEGDWSGQLWRLECYLYEAGCTREEVFAVVKDAACNKYARDKRKLTDLWIEVGKAEASVHMRRFDPEHSRGLRLKPLLTTAEEHAIKTDTYVDRFMYWGTKQTDAVPEYFIAGAFIVLSSLLAGNLRIPTQDSSVVPNLWFMLMGDTTTSRKTTTMSLSTGVLNEIDDDLLLATDGSIEGLLTAIQIRDGKPGIFHRDEFSSMLSQMQRKEYLTGIAEDFCRLYDGSPLKRVLRREIITIRKPIVILYTGGIKTQIMESLDLQSVTSGFVPRFLFQDSEGIPTQFRPTGPPTKQDTTIRQAVVEESRAIYGAYNQMVTLAAVGRPTRREFYCELDEKTWERYQRFEMQVYEEAAESPSPELYKPTFARMARSVLKASALLAASRQVPPKEGIVNVEMRDLIKVLAYAERWRENAISVVEHAGENVTERQRQTIYRAIKNGGEKGILRSELMQNHKLGKFEADQIFDTLEARGVIRRAVITGGAGKPGERFFDALA
jgi:hypothetical protein